MNTSKKIAIVPARKGSQRFPNKNNLLLNGNPLIKIVTDEIIKSELFDRIIVSTDDETITNYVLDNKNLELDIRDINLSDNKSTLIEVVRNVIEKNTNISNNDVICLMTVTNPLITAEDIVGGMELYSNTNPKNTIISVCDVDYPIELTWKLDESTNRLYNTHQISSTRKQDYKTSYRWNDGFVIDSVKSFMDVSRNNFGHNPTPYHMSWNRSFYIDYKWQYELIKLIKENEQFNKF